LARGGIISWDISLGTPGQSLYHEGYLRTSGHWIFSWATVMEVEMFSRLQPVQSVFLLKQECLRMSEASRSQCLMDMFLGRFFQMSKFGTQHGMSHATADQSAKNPQQIVVSS